MLEPTDDRLKASSMTLPSSMLTFLASAWIYLVGLSGFRNLNRGISVLATALDLGVDRMVLVLMDGPYDPMDV